MAAQSTVLTINREMVRRGLAKYERVALRSKWYERLADGDKCAVRLLVSASRKMDELYLRQSDRQNVAIHEALLSRSETDALELFDINMCPFDVLLDHDSSPAFASLEFNDKANERFAGAAFYPSDMSKQEFEQWDCADKRSFYTLVDRDDDGALVSRRYSDVYAEFLKPAADELRRAAAQCSEPSLRAFLEAKAASFENNDFDASDEQWLAVADTSPIEMAIGPYEVYTDRLFNLKAAFEAFLCLRDFDETAKLQKFAALLPELERALPIDDAAKRDDVKPAPIVVVDQLLVAGDRGGPQTAAFNLPNSERVVEAHGSKLTLLKNVQEAKFESILKPIAAIVLDAEQLPMLSFQAFFDHILSHEVCHSLGPRARAKLEELHSSLEEGKADICGLWALDYMIARGHLDATMQRSYWITFLASSFRSIRFGVSEAHGCGNAIILHALLDDGAYRVDANGRWSVNFERIADSVRALVARFMSIQASGDKVAARQFIDDYGQLRPQSQATLDKLAHLPIDIRPVNDASTMPWLEKI
jgi:Peptidase family M49